MGAADDLELIAFGDESCKPVRDRANGRVLIDQRFYATAVMVSMSGDHGELRAALDDVATLIGRQLHYRRLSSQQKLQALTALAEIPGGRASSTRRRRRSARGSTRNTFVSSCSRRRCRISAARRG